MDHESSRGWQLLERAELAGGVALTLEWRDELFLIRVDGRELMSSRVHGSEEAMARYGCFHLAGVPDARVLVGGLGMGYTLAAVLRRLPPTGSVVVAERVPEVLEWNRGVLGPLAGHPLDDPRTEVWSGDVGELLRSTTRPVFDAILLDVDNGPSALSLAENRSIYTPASIAATLRTLRPGGLLVIWSASDDPVFRHQMHQAHIAVRTRMVSERKGKRGAQHYLHVLAAGAHDQTHRGAGAAAR